MMENNAFNINKTNNQLSPQTIEHKGIWHMILEIQVLALGLVFVCA
jgi:hypothetical protein